MRALFAALFCSTLAVGCASPTAIRRGAYEHMAKAQTLEAQGDYYHASQERAAADKQLAKAQRREYDVASPGVYRF